MPGQRCYLVSFRNELHWRGVWRPFGHFQPSGALITYSAPASIPTPPTVSLTATSVSDNTRSASATITVAASNASVTLMPMRGGLTVGQPLNFTATVTNDVKQRRCSSGLLRAGSFKATRRTRPSMSHRHRQAWLTVTATSVADATKSALASIGVTDLKGVITYHNDYLAPGLSMRKNTRSQTLTSRLLRLERSSHAPSMQLSMRSPLGGESHHQRWHA